MKFAKVVFMAAGIYGLLALLPQYFMEEYNGRNYPPVITHPEYYYGFLGVAVAWQAAFLVLAKDPVRFRPMMIPAVLEKLSFGVAAVILYLQQRVPPIIVGFGLLDLMLAALFVAAYVKTAAGQETEQY
jgi:hypothetical protein